MKTPEIFELNNEPKNIFVHSVILNKYMKEKEWLDIAFYNLKSIESYVIVCRDDENEVSNVNSKVDSVEDYNIKPSFSLPGQMTRFIFKEVPKKRTNKERTHEIS